MYKKFKMHLNIKIKLNLNEVVLRNIYYNSETWYKNRYCHNNFS